MNKKKKEFKDFYEAFYWLVDHPIFVDGEFKENYGVEDSLFLQGLDISVAKVNPKTMSVDDDKKKNTKTEVWLEATYKIYKAEFGYIWHGDLDLETGGDTFEEAIINLAKEVFEKYGDYEIEKDS